MWVGGFFFPWQNHHCKLSVSNCLHHSFSLRVPALIKPAALCTPHPQITRDVQTRVQKDLAASGKETPVPAGKQAGRQLFEPCRGDGGRCKAPLCLSLRYIPLHPTAPTLIPSQHPPHPITRCPSQQTEGEDGHALKATTLLHLDLIFLIFFFF